MAFGQSVFVTWSSWGDAPGYGDTWPFAKLFRAIRVPLVRTKRRSCLSPISVFVLGPAVPVVRDALGLGRANSGSARYPGRRPSKVDGVRSRGFRRRSARLR